MGKLFLMLHAANDKTDHECLIGGESSFFPSSVSVAEESAC